MPHHDAHSFVQLTPPSPGRAHRHHVAHTQGVRPARASQLAAAFEDTSHLVQHAQVRQQAQPAATTAGSSGSGQHGSRPPATVPPPSQDDAAAAAASSLRTRTPSAPPVESPASRGRRTVPSQAAHVRPHRPAAPARDLMPDIEAARRSTPQDALLTTLTTASSGRPLGITREPQQMTCGSISLLQILAAAVAEGDIPKLRAGIAEDTFLAAATRVSSAIGPAPAHLHPGVVLTRTAVSAVLRRLTASLAGRVRSRNARALPPAMARSPPGMRSLLAQRPLHTVFPIPAAARLVSLGPATSRPSNQSSPSLCTPCSTPRPTGTPWLQ